MRLCAPVRDCECDSGRSRHRRNSARRHDSARDSTTPSLLGSGVLCANNKYQAETPLRLRRHCHLPPPLTRSDVDATLGTNLGAGAEVGAVTGARAVRSRTRHQPLLTRRTLKSQDFN